MKFKATYIDKIGIIEAEIQNNGEQFVLDIKGVKFISHFLDDFEIENKKEIPTRFSLNNHNQLTNCQLIFEIPSTFTNKDSEVQTNIKIDLYLNTPNPTTYDTNAIFSMEIGDKEITTNKVQLFENGLEILKRNLPAEYKLKCCYSCAFSDYSVYGQGFFGTMMCFRNIKKEYLKVKNKDEFMDIMDNYQSLVQETYLCNEFENRESGTGYRG